MQDENVFRFALVFGCAVLIPIALHHRLKAAATGEKLDRRAEGLFILMTGGLRLSESSG